MKDCTGEVYITYENSMRANVTGVYADRELAEKERDERGDLSCIDTFKIKGGYHDWNTSINGDCKYYIERINTLRGLISCLYSLEGCCCGGLAHIITDDENFQDSHINWIRSICDEGQNKDREEAGLVKLICDEMIKLSIQQRALLFSSYYSYTCDNNCENCCIEKGNVDDFKNN